MLTEVNESVDYLVDKLYEEKGFNNLNSWADDFSNVLKRFIVQVLLINKLRGFVFKKFAREK